MIEKDFSCLEPEHHRDSEDDEDTFPHPGAHPKSACQPEWLSLALTHFRGQEPALGAAAPQLEKWVELSLLFAIALRRFTGIAEKLPVAFLYQDVPLIIPPVYRYWAAFALGYAG